MMPWHMHTQRTVHLDSAPRPRGSYWSKQCRLGMARPSEFSVHMGRMSFRALRLGRPGPQVDVLHMGGRMEYRGGARGNTRHNITTDEQAPAARVNKRQPR